MYCNFTSNANKAYWLITFGEMKIIAANYIRWLMNESRKNDTTYSDIYVREISVVHPFSTENVFWFSI